MGKNGAKPGNITRQGLFRRATFVLLSGVLAGCGATTTFGGSPEATTTTIATTTTTTLPPTTTTTIDFNRPIDQDDSPLPEDATIGDVIALIDDMRGQTDSVYQQLARVLEFPKLASPIGSQILDFSVSVQAVEDGFFHQSLVMLRAPAAPTDLVDYFDAELISRGWNKADVSSQATDDGTLTTMVFRVPGTPGEDEELAVTLDQRPGVVMVELDHHAKTDDDDERLALLQAWQDPVRLPSSADVIEASVITTDDVATVTVIHRLQAETAAEAREDVIDLIRDDEFQTDAVVADGVASPITLVDLESGQSMELSFFGTGEEEAIDLSVSTSFALTPID